MRKQRLVLMLIMLMLTGNLFAQVEWQWLNPVITCNTLYDSDFINEQTGFITGEIGTLYKTNNAGTNWQKIFLPVTSNFNSIKFVNSTTGIISGDNSLILRTTNTGVNWVSVSNPGSGTLKDILYISSSFVLCVGGNSILKSTDLGLTWTNLSAYSTPYNFIKADYIDANNIFIAGYYFLYQFPTPIQRSVVLKSTNAGASWTEINVSGSSKFTSIKIINANNILITGNGDGAVFFKSTDQGNSWQNKTTSLVYENMGDMDFFDSNTGFAMASSGSNGRRFTTTDGGESWASVSLSGKFLNSVAVISQTQAYAAGVNGCLLKTTNKGANWVQLNEGFNIFGNFVNAHFLNENTGYAAGIGFGYPTYQGGSILKTTNGGSTWIYQSDTTISYGVLTDIYFTSVTRGYVCGENGLILRTTNSGTRWTYSLPTSYNLNSIRFSDSLNGVTCGGRVVMKTANGGNNWNTVYTDNNAQFVSVHFINNLIYNLK
ncbi:MAG: hypothetical protein J0M18_16875 [Ignavibacteria bacterium]|nr:hypothetical protein [Ignavibacteria bacterium]